MSSRKSDNSFSAVVLLSCCVLTLVFHGRDVLQFVKLLVNIVTGIDLSP